MNSNPSNTTVNNPKIKAGPKPAPKRNKNTNAPNTAAMLQHFIVQLPSNRMSTILPCRFRSYGFVLYPLTLLPEVFAVAIPELFPRNKTKAPDTEYRALETSLSHK
ncbi:hypothetical protein [Sagittula sp. SSi028]|uniref:hypothetical protein n=1 Tax=Sagittula sp. SSi028 TaxID=3400636 RepID=UPI003AF4A140